MTTQTVISYRRTILAAVLGAFAICQARSALACGGGSVGSMRGPAGSREPANDAEPNFKKLGVGIAIVIVGAIVGKTLGVVVVVIGVGVIATMGVAELTATVSQLLSDIKSFR